MSRDFFINGETMVGVKSRSDSLIPSLTNLGLAVDRISVSFDFRQKDVSLDAWGKEIPAEVQVMLGAATIRMNLVHYDNSVLDECVRLSMGGTAAAGTLARAGTRLGNALARFAAGNNFISLNLTSPIGARPWRFYTAYLAGQPIEYPLGTEKSIVACTWRAIPYLPDPWNGGAGALGVVIWDHGTDT